MSYYFAKNWEMFYTTAKNQDEDKSFVDQISIDMVNKVYVLYQDVHYGYIDGCDADGNEYYSTYVSREFFDLVLQALKLNGYKQAQFLE